MTFINSFRRKLVAIRAVMNVVPRSLIRFPPTRTAAGDFYYFLNATVSVKWEASSTTSEKDT